MLKGNPNCRLLPTCQHQVMWPAVHWLMMFKPIRRTIQSCKLIGANVPFSSVDQTHAARSQHWRRARVGEWSRKRINAAKNKRGSGNAKQCNVHCRFKTAVVRLLSHCVATRIALEGNGMCIRMDQPANAVCFLHPKRCCTKFMNPSNTGAMATASAKRNGRTKF